MQDLSYNKIFTLEQVCELLKKLVSLGLKKRGLNAPDRSRGSRQDL